MVNCDKMIKYANAQFSVVSFVVIEGDEFKGSIVFQSGNINNPFSASLKSLFVLQIPHPEVNFSEVLSHLQANTVHLFEDLFCC
jgi:hypothetical protein